MNVSKLITRREKILLLVLAAALILAAYYFGVQRTVQTTRTAIAQQQAAAAQTLAELKETQKAMAQMQTELGTVQSGTQTPAYDNLQQLMNFLNPLFPSGADYTLDFDVTQPGEGENIVRRTVHMTFTTETYQRARQVVEQIRTCPYRCQLEEVTMAPSQQEDHNLRSGSVDVALTAVFFEIIQ